MHLDFRVKPENDIKDTFGTSHLSKISSAKKIHINSSKYLTIPGGGILGEPNKSDSALQSSCLANSIYKE